MAGASALATVTEIREWVREAVRDEIGNQLEPLRGQQNLGQLADVIDLAIERKKREEREAGSLINRVILSVSYAKKSREAALDYAKRNFPDDTALSKALEAGLETAGGFLITDEVAADVIELLRPESVVRSLNPRVVPLDAGTLRMPKHTAGSSGGWIGENQNAPATQPAFGQVVLTAKKYASLVPLSNDLIRRATVAPAQNTVRDDLVADIATATDLAYIRGDGSSGMPKGFLSWVPSANKFAATTPTSPANTVDDLGRCMQILMDNNVRIRNAGWIMEPRTWRYLFTLLDANANPIFREEMRGGTLFGFPFRVTTQIPRNLGGGNDSELYFVNFDDIVIGEATSILLSASEDAAYHDGAAVVAAFSMDQTVVRAIVEVDLAPRHDEAIVVVDTLTWGL